MQAVTTYFPYHSPSEASEFTVWRRWRRRVKPLASGVGLGAVLSGVAWALASLL